MHTTRDRGIAVAAVDHLEVDPIGNTMHVRLVLAYCSGDAVYLFCSHFANVCYAARAINYLPLRVSSFVFPLIACRVCFVPRSGI